MELKIIIAKKKFIKLLEGFKDRLDQVEERIHEFEDKTIEIIKSEVQKEKSFLKNE